MPVLLAALQLSCSSPKMATGDYSHCEDLGTLTQKAFSPAEAEQGMRTRVEELGGDMLLFSARSSTEASDVPAALLRRRKQLVEPLESINGQQPVAGPVTESGQTTQEERWYYGTALRCKR